MPNTDVTYSLPSGQLISFGSAVPTVGSWTRGDFRINTEPDGAGPFGWQCAASGTPGTWFSFGVPSETVRTVTETGNVYVTDRHVICNNAGNNIVLTLPDIFPTGVPLHIHVLGTGSVTLDPAGSTAISPGAATLALTANDGASSAIVFRDSTPKWYAVSISGAFTASN